MLRSTLFFVASAAALLVAASAPAGTLVVANKSEATVSLVDTVTKRVRATLPTGNGPHEVAVSPDGTLALVGNYGSRHTHGSSLTLLDVPSAKVVKTIKLEGYTRPHGIVWRDGDHALVTVETSKAVIEVDVGTGQVVREIGTGADLSHMVALAPDGSRAFVTNIGSGSVTVIDLDAGVRIGEVATGDGAEGITVTPDGKQVWVTNRKADTVTVLDATTLERLAELRAGSFPIRAEATPDGRFVLVSNLNSGDLSVFSTSELRELRRVSFTARSKGGEGRLFDDVDDSSAPIGIQITPDGLTAFVAHANADEISILDLETWQVTGTLTAGKEPDGMGYSQGSGA